MSSAAPQVLRPGAGCAGDLPAGLAAVREVFRAAVERREARRNADRGCTEAERRQAWVEGRALDRLAVTAPGFRGPGNLGEWLDDRVVERGPSLHSYPETPVLYGVLEAAREGPAAAARAVRAARRLGRRVQAVAYRNVVAWKAHPDAPRTGAEPVLNSVLAEWERLGLAGTDPDDEEDW